MSLDIQPRVMWMAREPKKVMIPDIITPVLYVFFSYVLKDYANRKSIKPGPRPNHLETCRELLYIQRGDLRKLPDIRFNFMIGMDGTVYEGRGWDKRPTLPRKYSHLTWNSLYVGFIGDFRVREFWGALPYRGKSATHLVTPVSTVLVYDYDRCKPCISDFDCTREVQAIQLRQRRRRLPDMQYNFLVGGMGRVYEGRGWHVRPEVDRQHKELEDDCLLLAMIGKGIGEAFGPHRKMRFQMMWGLEEFLRYGVENHYIEPYFLQYNVGLCARQGAVDIPDHILKKMAKPEPRPKLPF